jgi:hypothetical protein
MKDEKGTNPIQVGENRDKEEWYETEETDNDQPDPSNELIPD